MNLHRPLTGAERAKRWRAAMRAKGLRPRTLWVPDPSSPAFREAMRRSAEAIDRWSEDHRDEIDDVLALQYSPADDVS